MTLEQCIEKIDRYLKREYADPMVVDVQNNADLEALVTHYRVGSNKFVHAKSFCKKDELPQSERMVNAIGKETGNVFLCGLSAFLFMKGDAHTIQALGELLSMRIEGHVVIMTYQCSSELERLIQRDSRRTGRICIVEGVTDPLPKLIFVSEGFAFGNNAANGVHEIADIVEKEKRESLYVRTEKSKTIYPASLLTIEEIKTAFAAICQIDPIFGNLKESCGDPKQWGMLLNRIIG